MSPRHSWPEEDTPLSRPDVERQHRAGVPEVILANRKPGDTVLTIVRHFMEHAGRALLSRVPPRLEQRLKEEWTRDDVVLDWYPHARAMVIRRSDFVVQPNGGRVGVITAGTADIPIAEEAIMLLKEMGCEVCTAFDVGVAGLHRLFEPLQRLIQEVDVDVIIVAAGMDGALPSVVSGLVDVPVIGLPTSVGYGFGGRGHSALLSMLQTCAPGLAVVNIDNGIGAAAVAGLIAVRAARARAGLTRPSQETAP